MEYSTTRNDSVPSSLVADGVDRTENPLIPETHIVEGDGNVLKKVGIVAAAAIGLSMIATPAIASADPIDSMDEPGMLTDSDNPSFGDAYNTFILGGGSLGAGAAALVAGAYTGIAMTPALIANSFDED
jgi:hypothetical protein